MVQKWPVWSVCLGLGMLGATLPAQAETQVANATPPLLPTREAIPLDQLPRPATNVQEWLTQVDAATPRVIGVKVNPTPTELEIILETAEGKRLLIDATKFRREGNSLIADISGAVLALPGGQPFTAQNPTADIATVQVLQQDANSIRISVTGTTALPKTQVTLKTGGLAYALNPGKTDEDQEVVVTNQQPGYRVPNTSVGTRTDTPLRDIPQSIQVIPRRIIEDQKAIRILDVLQNVSGVTTAQGYGSGPDDPSLRGFPTASNLRNGFYTLATSFVTNNIERVEVLRGPASVLYGQLEPGGVINYVTRKPLENPYYAADITIGSYNLYNPTFDISGPLNSSKTFLYRLNASYLSEGSFIDFVNRKQFGIALALTYKPSSATTIDFEYEHINERSIFNDGLPLDPISFRLPISRFLGDPNSSNATYSANNIYLTLNHRFNQQFRIRTSLGAQLNNFKTDTVRLGGLLPDGRSVSRGYGSDEFKIQNFTWQTDFISQFRTGSIQHETLIGLELSRQLFPGSYYFAGDSNPIPPLDIFNPVYGGFTVPDRSQLDTFFSDLRQDTIGVYVQDQITLHPKLKMLIGGRYDFIFRRNTEQGVESRLYDGAFSPRIGIVYQPIRPISLYASYSRSFAPSTSRTADGALFSPERGLQYEIGLKADLTRQLALTLAAYEIAKTNVATTDPNNPIFSVATGEVRSRGIELDLTGQILPGWNIITSAYVNRAFISKDNTTPIGDRFINAPSVGASLWTTYEFQRSRLKGFGFGGGVFFIGDRETSLPNDLVLPSYVRAEATVFYRRDNWRLGLNFKNITNTRYYDSQGVSLRPGAPFTVFGSFSVNF
jgi:iron complex outermembrane recepter protein